ncbi:hypothetical protein MO973_05055 [Paenibacillus sp. TRM 82003]|nr:hypothetical protein [Paenibacillus sp. TRM 82003]
MQLICGYPVQEASLQGYCGQTVVAMTVHGDLVCGTLDSCANGQLVLKPVAGQGATVQSLRKEMERALPKGKRPAGRKGKALVLTKDTAKADVSFFGPGLGYGYGYGYGADAALLTLSLFTLAAVWASPFFFI